MRSISNLSLAVLSICLLAADAKGAVAKSSKKASGVPAPARPAGVAKPPDPGDAYYGGAKLDTITEFHNELGQTVYSIAASHFDISAPLRDMAAAAASEQQEEQESPTNPQLPASRIVRSDLPDPVVQVAPTTERSLSPNGVVPAAPTTGFNFLGVGISGGTPSDSNGSVGNNQFVETVNVRYQIWSLNRATMTATSVLGPSNINTLWSGFGGACQTQNSGDPIVLYDKTAKRWLISQFTSSATNGVYYQCVALSTTQDATGTYARYAFAVPNGKFGDYPHFGVWPPAAYFMMAHGFGGTFAAIFAALDRTKMIAGSSGATWQVIQDPSEGGHMPADLDGFAVPPTLAPGIFVSLHDDGMYIYRMKVSFSGAGSSSKTLQAIVPTAAASAACGGGTCIPQPGVSNVLDALSDRLMFRAAYRNYVDHESLVVSHSVDPGVSGVVSGVRWYDIRLSGTADATCPNYPCMYQQGTIADVPSGRSRWMPSVAMDGAENVLVGYSATGTADGSDNHSIRYTGRAKADAPGTMTAPETTIATGTANNLSTSRWGDYSSMSIDPFDDCTFWYVNQYDTAPSAWSTRIASAAFPSGSGGGQCPATSCNTRPALQPQMGTPVVPGDNQITLSWTGITPTPGGYAIERAEGACGVEGLYRPLAAVVGTITTFTDTTVQGGITYAYRVRATADAAGRCQALLAGTCVSATATGTCSLSPSFGGATSAASGQQSNCGMTINWTPGASHCPQTGNLRYDVFRGAVPDFVPSLANRIAACVPGPSSYLDTDNLSSGTTYYYVVRARDIGTGNPADCGGNEESNTVTVSGTAYASGLQSAPGTWTDGGGDGTAFLLLNVAGPGDTGDHAWRVVKTANDSGANHTPGGAYAYRNAGPAAGSTYQSASCTETQTTSLTAAGTSVDLTYWERHQLEYQWDGVAVEYSVNGGAWADVPAPSNSAADGCDPADATSDWQPLTCSQGSGGNACGFSTTKPVFTGPYGSGSSCSDFATSATVSAYAHRCHSIAGLSPGDAIRFRWRFSSDSAATYAGLYLDDIAVTDVQLPNACAPNTCGSQADGSPCNGGVACTTGDACAGGACQPGSPVASPPEINGMRVDGRSNTTVTWTAPGGPVVYDVASSTLSDLRVNGTTTATCAANDVAITSFGDGRPDPPAGEGYYFIVRAQSTCASGSYGLDSAGAPRVPASACP